MARSAFQPCLTLSTAITPAASPLTAPTERSISPSSRTNTTPTEIVPIGRDLQRQVGQVDGREEAVVLQAGRSSRSPRSRSAPGRSRARPEPRRVITLSRPSPLAPRVRAVSVALSITRLLLDARALTIGTGDRRHDLLLVVFSRFEGRRPALPSRSTTIRSATSKTFSRLWLITTTPRPRSRRRVDREPSTCAVCATPSAAVGSSSNTTFGSPSRERAIATDCRCPPERLPTSRPHAAERGHGELVEQLARVLLHLGLVEGRKRDTAVADHLLPEIEVGDDVEVVTEREVLVDRRDPELGGCLGAR